MHRKAYTAAEKGARFLDGLPCPYNGTFNCDDCRECARALDEAEAEKRTQVVDDPGAAWCASVGFDVGFQRDYSAICVLAPTEDGERWECVYAARLPLVAATEEYGQFRGQAQILAAAIGQYLDSVKTRVRLLFDATGTGLGTAGVIREELPVSRRLDVHPVVYRGEGERPKHDDRRWLVPKVVMVERLMVMLENEQLLIGEFDDADLLRRELVAFQGRLTASGVMRYDAATSGGTGHDDLVNALMMSVYGAVGEGGGGFRVIGNPADPRYPSAGATGGMFVRTGMYAGGAQSQFVEPRRRPPVVRRSEGPNGDLAASAARTVDRYRRTLG
jgi:hypothetical protein